MPARSDSYASSSFLVGRRSRQLLPGTSAHERSILTPHRSGLLKKATSVPREGYSATVPQAIGGKSGNGSANLPEQLFQVTSIRDGTSETTSEHGANLQSMVDDAMHDEFDEISILGYTGPSCAECFDSHQTSQRVVDLIGESFIKTESPAKGSSHDAQSIDASIEDSVISVISETQETMLDETSVSSSLHARFSSVEDPVVQNSGSGLTEAVLAHPGPSVSPDTEYSQVPGTEIEIAEDVGNTLPDVELFDSAALRDTESMSTTLRPGISNVPVDEADPVAIARTEEARSRASTPINKGGPDNVSAAGSLTFLEAVDTRASPVSLPSLATLLESVACNERPYSDRPGIVPLMSIPERLVSTEIPFDATSGEHMSIVRSASSSKSDNPAQVSDIATPGRSPGTPVSHRPNSRKLSTPPPRARHSMDIPLSRPVPSVELWENSCSLVRRPQSRSPSPVFDASGPGLVPSSSSNSRLEMDIPLPRGLPSTSDLQSGIGGSHNHRRTTSDMRRRSFSSMDFEVKESPQKLSSSFATHSPNAEPLPLRAGLPKLDFGVKLQHAHSLTEDDDFPQLLQPLDYDIQDVVRESTESRPLLAPIPLRRRRPGPKSPKSFVKPLTPRPSASPSVTYEQSDEGLDERDSRTTSRSSELTPRTAYRKQLSDDIDLDITSTTMPRRLVPLHAQSTPRERPTEETMTLPQLPTMPTPILGMSRKRDIPTTASSGSQLATKQRSKQNRQKDSAVDSRVKRKSNLDVFGRVPEVLPRSRRERRKPSEYWKATSEHVETSNQAVPLTRAKSRPSPVQTSF